MAKVTRKVWTSRGPTGKRVKRVSWGYTLRVNGQREKHFSNDWTETEALAALTARLKEVEAGGLQHRRDRTLGEVAQEYLDRKRREGKRSVADDERILRRQLLPAFGPATRLRALSRALIAQYRERRLAEVSASTVSNELAVLRHLLRGAQEVGDLDTVPPIKCPRKPEGRLRYLEEEEIEPLLAACRESRNRALYPVVVLALHTGMRKGEILSLTWEQIDFSSARITLHQTKSGKPRGVPTNGDVDKVLRALEPDPGRRQGRLFPVGNDRRGSQIRTAFENALERAGIKGFRFHDLRHTAASHLVMRGASLQDVKEVLGHADLRMTLRYAHLTPAHLRTAVGRLEGLGTLVPAEPVEVVPAELRIPVGPTNGPMVGFGG